MRALPTKRSVRIFFAPMSYLLCVERLYRILCLFQANAVNRSVTPDRHYFFASIQQSHNILLPFFSCFRIDPAGTR